MEQFISPGTFEEPSSFNNEKKLKLILKLEFQLSPGGATKKWGSKNNLYKTK